MATRLPLAQEAQICDLYISGYTSMQIAALLGCSYTTVFNVTHRYNIPSRPSHKLADDPIARFWRNVDTSGECWLWQAHRNHGGYGEFFLTRPARQHVLAHRYSYELACGPIPDGLMLCHTCDHPACVRPVHLFAGTATDNVRDCVSKGRHLHGEQHHKARLTELQVQEIQARWAAGGVTQRALAKNYGVTQRAIWNIVHALGWKHLNPR